MPGEITVREAVPQDAEALARLHLTTWRQTYAGVLSDAFLQGLPLGPRLDLWHRVLAPGSPARTWVLEDRVPCQDPGPDRRHEPGEEPATRVCGFASTRAGGPQDPRELELWGIYLLADRQRQGLGQRLWDRAVGDRPCFLWVAEQNQAAVAFYRRNRMEPDGGQDRLSWMEGLPVLRMVR